MNDLKALLIDVDSTIPNLALMKISSWLKTHGYIVDIVRCMIPIYGNRKSRIINCAGYDRVYASAIFDNTWSCVKLENAPIDTVIGGTGIDIKSKLPDEIYSCNPDYSIYPDNDCSYGFISRGCFRNCKHCVVPEKEGVLYQETKSVRDLIKHKKVKFLDNNFLGLINHKSILRELIDLGIRCQFNQGLDIRILDEEDAILLSKLNYLGEYIFAFDNVLDQTVIEEKLLILKRHILTPWKIKFFIYCHPNMDIKADVYYRILWCKENKVLPYFMRHVSCWKSKEYRTYNDFSAWCNQPGIFKSHTYEEFCKKRRPQENRNDVYPDWFVGC